MMSRNGPATAIRDAILVLLALGTAACGDPSAQVRVDQTRLVAAGSAAAGYMTLVNSGGADRLLAIEAPGNGATSLHSTSTAGGIMRMRAIENGIAVPAGETVELSPMGNHLMIQGIAKPLAPGSEAELVLRFERQGAVKAMAKVEAPGAPAMDR